MLTKTILIPDIIIEDYQNRFNKIKNNYINKFDIEKCKNNKELIGYYLYLIFDKNQQDDTLEILYYDQLFDLQDIITGFYKIKLKYILNFKTNNQLKIFIKEFIIENELSYYKSLREIIIGNKISELENEIPGFVFTFLHYEEYNIREMINNKYTKNVYIDDKNKYKNILLFTEYVGDKSFENILENIEEYDIINIYLQVVLSLNAINQYYNFSHNDLHLGNIIIMELEEPKILTYKVLLNDKKVKINLKVDKYLTKIIDFGFSSIKYKYKNEEILSYNLFTEIDNYFPREPFPEGDIIKLTAKIYNLIKNIEFKNIFYNILKYSVKDINEYIESFEENLFYLNYDNWNYNKYNQILNFILYESKISNYINNISIEKQKIIKCNYYLTEDILFFEENENINKITLKKYVNSIIDKYIKTGKFSHGSEDIFDRFSISYKNLEYYIEKSKLEDLIIIMYDRGEKSNYLNQFIYNNIVNVLYNYEIDEDFVDILLNYLDPNTKYTDVEYYDKNKSIIIRNKLKNYMYIIKLLEIVRII
uniref:Protein kinase domain-containing protein n=1 Tax=Pithovirus LCDPAC02 TaxID=2506601 RepID=A0A481YPI1_9VIRU|nr:MAG: hypothetical protein LCDPAC02_00660 [Pithovirus LCDPAC02]